MVQIYLQKFWTLEIYIRLNLEPKGKLERPNLWLSKYRKKIIKIRVILNNWKTAIGIEARFTLKKRAKREENMPG